MKQEGRTISPEQHLTPDEIAALADGLQEQGEAARLERHLVQCRRCFESFSEAVLVRLESRAHPEAYAPDPGLIEEAQRMWRHGPGPAGSRPGEAPGERPRRWSGSHARSFRWALSGAAVAAVVLAGMWTRQEAIWRETLAPVRAAMAPASSGGLVYPGIAAAPGKQADVYRSGGGVRDTSLERSLDDLYARYERDPRSARVAYWLVAGLAESGQLSAARRTLDAARKRSPGDLRLCVLDAILAYRENRLAEAESLLRGVLEKDPNDRAARTNLARVHGERAGNP